MLNKILRKIRGLKLGYKLYRLKKRGMVFGRDFRCMGGVNFGSEPYLLKFGDHITVSFGVAFVTHDGATWVYRETDKAKYTKFGPIVIGDNCFFGYKSIILPGVTLGSDCIVAAGSVVTKSFPSGVVVGGVPAKKITSTSKFIDKCVADGQMIPAGRHQAPALKALFAEQLS